MDILSEFGLDPEKFALGNLCKRGHDFEGTGKSLRYLVTTGRYAGRPGTCRDCKDQKWKQWKQENSDRYLESNKRYYHENRDRMLEGTKRYYQEHREERIAYTLEWEKRYKEKDPERYAEIRRKCQTNYRLRGGQELLKKRRVQYAGKYRRYYQDRYLANREDILAKSSKWKKANPERGVASSRRRRARKLNNHFVAIAPDDLTKHLERFSGVCAYCQEAPFTDWDHFIPVSKGGSEVISNLVPACKKCNSRKNARDPLEWYASQPFYSEKQWKNILKILGKNPKTYNQIPLL